MKSYFYKSLLLSCVVAASAGAISLYDMAPSVGLPESHAVKYNVYGRVGYDSNVGSTTHAEGRSSLYVNGGLGASYADFESVDKISYNINIGATRYLQSASSDDKRMFADCGVRARVVHAFSARASYSASLHVSYSPEPDYASGISASRRQGDCLNWSFSNAYNHSIDSRLSWNVNAGYSGNTYSESLYQNDDRRYLNAGVGANYRSSELLSYNANFSYRYDIRQTGYDSNNLTASIGFNRSLDPVSSCHGSLGLQTKYVSGKSILTPNLNLGYNRKVAEGLNMNAYLTLTNENVDTYRGAGQNYLSDVTWRMGLNCSYVLSPDVSFSFGMSVMRAQYSEGTGRLQDEVNTTVSPSLGFTYRFSDDLVGNINYQYTWYDTDRKGAEGYTRHNISTGLTYNF